MRRLACAVMLAVALAAAPMFGQAAAPRGASAKTLDIYFIDVEGGQSTLVVTPAGESLLIDTGFPGDGTFSSKAGDAAKARDAQRVLAAAKAAGVKQIDYLLLTHYHADHAGGVVELARLLPIKTFVDHAAPSEAAEKAVAGTQAIYDAYVALRATGKHLEPNPGDRLPINGLDAVIVATNGRIISKPLAGAGQKNDACAGTGREAQEKTENPNSTSVRLQFGKFSFLDVGDLSGAPLFALTCPANLIGESDVYLIAHHGGNDAADPALYAAVKPLVAVFNNGSSKGAQKDTLAAVRAIPSIDGWQLHRTSNAGAENNPDDRIANLDETTSAWIKVSAKDDGTFTVTNGRTGVEKRYKRN